VCGVVTLTKTGLVTPGTFSPLGVNKDMSCNRSKTQTNQLTINQLSFSQNYNMKKKN
jgi:hypothetical protein